MCGSLPFTLDGSGPRPFPASSPPWCRNAAPGVSPAVTLLYRLSPPSNCSNLQDRLRLRACVRRGRGFVGLLQNRRKNGEARPASWPASSFMCEVCVR